MLTNSQFLAELAAGTNAALWVAGFHGEPGARSDWGGQPYDVRTRRDVDRWQDRNAYFSVAGLKPIGGQVKRRKVNFQRLLCLVADDVELSALVGNVSWVLTTSPGKHQAGILLDPECGDCMDAALVDRLMKHMGQLGLTGFSDPSGNNACRYVRLPMGRNEKPRPTGPYPHRMERWNPEVRYSLTDAAAVFGIDLDALRQEPTEPRSPAQRDHGQGSAIAEAAANIIHGDALHESVNRFAASCVAQGMPGGAVVNITRTLMQVSEAPKDERWKERFTDIPRAVTTAQEKYQPKAATAPLTAIQENEAPGFSEVPIADLFSVPAKPHPHFIAQILPARVVTLLAGHGGLGKSFLLLLMAAHVAVGRNFAGLTTTRARVLVVSLEDDGEILRSRLRAICEVYDIAPTDLARDLRVFDASDCGALMSECAVPGGGRELHDTLLMERIAELAQSCDVLMVDNASEALDANENERRMVRAFLRRLKGLVKTQGGAVLLLAHINKSGARERSTEDYSGSTAWNNSVRSRLALTEESDGQSKLEHQKANLGPKAAPIYLSRTMNGVAVFRDAPASTQLQCRSLTDDAAVMAAIRDAWEAGRPVTGAKAGTQTTLHVLPEILPAPIPRNRLRAALIRLEQSGMFETVALRTPVQRKEKPFLKTAECTGDPFAPRAPLAPLAPDTVEVAHPKQATLSAPLAPLQCAGGMGVKSVAQEVEQERQTEGEQS